MKRLTVKSARLYRVCSASRELMLLVIMLTVAAVRPRIEAGSMSFHMMDWEGGVGLISLHVT